MPRSDPSKEKTWFGISSSSDSKAPIPVANISSWSGATSSSESRTHIRLILAWSSCPESCARPASTGTSGKGCEKRQKGVKLIRSPAHCEREDRRITTVQSEYHHLEPTQETGGSGNDGCSRSGAARLQVVE